MGFTTFDGVIIVLYLIGIAMFGMMMGGRQASVKDYFISEKTIPWWAVCITIVATETSALTFLSLPGIAWAGSMVFLQLALGYILGRIFVAVVLIPRYFEGESYTAYTILEKYFGSAIRRTASITFMLTRLFADGVRLYTTAIPLALLFQRFEILPELSATSMYVLSIALLTTLTLVYVFVGGIRAVIWTDVLQWTVYVFGAVVSIVVLLKLIPLSVPELFSTLLASGKLQVVDAFPEGTWSALLTEPYSLLGGVVGGMVLSIASHGTDQIIVQRVLAAGHPKPAKKAMILSGGVVFVQFALFLFVGALLWKFDPSPTLTANEVFASFILNYLPTGLSGLIVAGVLAAAMSTLSSSISALGSSTMLDIILPLRRTALSPDRALKWSRKISIVWACLLLLVATLFIGTPQAVVELALSIASFTYGGLLGLFVLGIFARHISTRAVLSGFAIGIIGNGLIILYTPLAWIWYTLSGVLLTIATARIVSILLPAKAPESKR